MSGDTPHGLGYHVAEDGTFHAPLVLSYPYKRTTGPTMSRFLRGLGQRRIEATVGSDGTRYVPPAEFDPSSGEPLTTWSSVGDEGTVVTWSWQPTVDDASPLPHPFAWALITLDGADSALLHVVDIASPTEITTGARVNARWAPQPTGSMRDLEAFEVVPTESEHG